MGRGARLGYLGDWGEGGVWVQRVKNRFLHHCLSVCLSPSLSLPLAISKVKVGEVAGQGPPRTLRLSAFETNLSFQKAESLSPEQWPGRLGAKGDPCFPPLPGPEGDKTPRTGALALWGTHCLLSEN